MGRADGSGGTRGTVVARFEARRNEERVLAEGALAGERRAALARLVMVALFASSFELVSRVLGEPPPFDPWRVGVGLFYAVLALGSVFALRRRRADPVLAMWVPLFTTMVDFAFMTFMAVRAIDISGVAEPEMVAIGYAIFIAFAVRRLSWIHVLASTALACLCYAFLSWYAGVPQQAATPFVLGGFVTLGLLVGFTNQATRRMFRDLRRRDALSRFLPLPVAETLIAQGDQALAPVQREVTVLFSDIRGFTSLSEREPPQQVLALLDDYFGRMTQVVKGHDGMVNKFLGDGMLAVWGAPGELPEHASAAVAAALDMQRALTELNASRQAGGLEPLRIGIGIHTGIVAAGMLGGSGQTEYTVIGDAVNLTARIEAMTKELDVDLLVSDATWRRLGGRFPGRQLGETPIRGRSESVVLHAVDGER